MIEQIFAIPGIGRYYVTAVNARDYSVVMGLTVLLSMIIIIANIVRRHPLRHPRPAHAGRADVMASSPRETAATDGLAPSSRCRARPRARAIRQSNLWRDAWRRYIRNKGAVVAGAVFVLLVLYCVSGRSSRPTTRNEVDFARRSRTRAWQHPFGTDKFGRDLFTRTALGGRVSILIGFGATIAILLIGVFYGSISGFVGGRLDNGMMRFLDALYGLPYLPFAIITLAIIGRTDNGR